MTRNALLDVLKAAVSNARGSMFTTLAEKQATVYYYLLGYAGVVGNPDYDLDAPMPVHHDGGGIF